MKYKMSFSEIIDTQYAKSISPTGTPIGRYSESWITGAIGKIIAEQKARLGRFLTYQRLLLDLRGRAESIIKADPTRGRALLNRVNVSLTNQARLEREGMTLIGTISAIQSNPIIQLITTKTVTPSTEITLRGDKLIAQLKDLTVQSAGLNNALSDHESTVARLEKDIKNIEGELVGRGFVPKVTKLFEKPMQMLKYVAIIGGIGALVYFLPKKKALR